MAQNQFGIGFALRINPVHQIKFSPSGDFMIDEVGELNNNLVVVIAELIVVIE